MTDDPPEGLDQFDTVREERDGLPRALKLVSLTVALALIQLGGAYAGIGRRMQECGTFLEFACYRIADCDDIVRKLVRCSWCRVRLCLLCERAKARKRHLQLVEILTAWFRKWPKHSALLLTLTTRSVSDSELMDAIDQLMASFRRLTRCASFKRAVLGWYRTLEVTRNADTGLWHAHIHVLLIVGPAYFRRSSKLYLDHKAWQALWRKWAHLDYDPVVDIRALAGVGGGPVDELGEKSLLEIAKYCTQPSDIIDLDDNGEPFPADPQIIKTLFDALRGRRLTGMSAPLRAIANELGHVDPDDDNADFSIAEQIPDGAVYLGREAYRWHAGAREYLRVPYVEWQSPAQEAPMQPP